VEAEPAQTPLRHLTVLALEVLAVMVNFLAVQVVLQLEQT
jgi:hypothetical protein